MQENHTGLLCIYTMRRHLAGDVECSELPGSDDCSIPFRHRLSAIPHTAHYAQYRSWAHNDTVLDWYGAEQGQGRDSAGHIAAGSPTVWTTNDQSNMAAFHPLNRYRRCMRCWTHKPLRKLIIPR